VVDGPHGNLGARLETQPAEDVADVRFGGAARDHQRLGDAAVAPALGDQGSDFSLARCQAIGPFDRGAHQGLVERIVEAQLLTGQLLGVRPSLAESGMGAR